MPSEDLETLCGQYLASDLTDASERREDAANFRSNSLNHRYDSDAGNMLSNSTDEGD
jgi:hypothetical protein